MINAIICEFNPFHNGHKYLLEKAAEKTGAEATVCIMSGNFVQRGEGALWDKHTRAAAAVRGGADLVLQLPTAHSLSSATFFARSGVFIANALGVPTSLCFGSEAEDISPLFLLSQIEPERLAESFKAAAKTGMSYAAAAQSAYESFGTDASILKTPNNLLAFEYIKAAKDTDLQIVNIPRVGDIHDGSSPRESFASASYIRKNIARDMSAFASGLTPPRLDPKKLEQLLLFSVYNKTAEQLCGIADMTEGLENRFYEVSRSADSFDALCEGVKSKRYTAAKIRRTAISVLLQNPKGLYKRMPDCLRVLAFNDRGRALLKKLADTASLPVITKPADCEKLGSLHFELECRATDIYDFCCFDRRGGGSEYKISPIYIK